MENRIPLAVIAGPTASGKTAAGVRVAQLLGGEVISADSMQIYKHLTVGTAKPLVQEMQGVPHHLIDFLEPSESFSVADYVQLKGFAEQNGVQALWQRLDEVDPAAAQKIHPNNVGRVVRALEVFYTTGTPISRQQELSRQQPSPYRLCMMALGFRDRQKLYDRINLRVTRMVEDGLEQEARWLREQGYSATSFQAIGYKEMGLYLDGEETLEQACERIRQESRRYAKRQLTWFRRDERYHWFWADEFADAEQMHRQMAQLAQQMLLK